MGLRRTQRQGRKEARKGYLLIAPALLLSISIILIPGLLTTYISFTNWDGVSRQLDWVGLDNFRRIAGHWVFWKAVSNNVIWTALFLTVPVLIGMVSALLLLRRHRSRSLYQLIFLVPYVLAPVTNAMLWLNIIFNPVAGLIGWLRRMGWDITPPLANRSTALYAVAGVDMWHYWGFLTVIYLAALRQTPVEQIESALTDGANGWQTFRHIYLPSMRPTMLLMFVMIMIFSFLTFDYVFLLTGGGPAHATEMLSTYAYTLAFRSFLFGRASAVGLTMSIFALVGAFLYVWLSRKDITE
jgi:raffinose/stachyose/melibiose transport system permease protein